MLLLDLMLVFPGTVWYGFQHSYNYKTASCANTVYRFWKLSVTVQYHLCHPVLVAFETLLTHILDMLNLQIAAVIVLGFLSLWECETFNAETRSGFLVLLDIESQASSPTSWIPRFSTGLPFSCLIFWVHDHCCPTKFLSEITTANSLDALFKSVIFWKQEG